MRVFSISFGSRRWLSATAFSLRAPCGYVSARRTRVFWDLRYPCVLSRRQELRIRQEVCERHTRSRPPTRSRICGPPCAMSLTKSLSRNGSKGRTRNVYFCLKYRPPEAARAYPLLGGRSASGQFRSAHGELYAGSWAAAELTALIGNEPGQRHRSLGLTIHVGSGNKQLLHN